MKLTVTLLPAAILLIGCAPLQPSVKEEATTITFDQAMKQLANGLNMMPEESKQTTAPKAAPTAVLTDKPKEIIPDTNSTVVDASAGKQEDTHMTSSPTFISSAGKSSESHKGNIAFKRVIHEEAVTQKTYLPKHNTEQKTVKIANKSVSEPQHEHGPIFKMILVSSFFVALFFRQAGNDCQGHA